MLVWLTLGDSGHATFRALAQSEPADTGRNPFRVIGWESSGWSDGGRPERRREPARLRITPTSRRRRSSDAGGGL